MNLYLISIAVLLILIIFLSIVKSRFEEYITIPEGITGVLIGLLIGFIIIAPPTADFPNYSKKYYHVNEDLSLKEIEGGEIHFHKPFGSRIISSSTEYMEFFDYKMICGVKSTITLSGPEFEFEALAFRDPFRGCICESAYNNLVKEFNKHLNQNYPDREYDLEKLNKFATDFMRTHGLEGRLQLKVAHVISE